MFIFRHGGRHAVQLSRHSITPLSRRHASKIAIPFAPPPFPIVEKCPAATCTCREQPPGLDIEREQNINGSIAAYAEQVLISTGRHDWKSKIEDDEDAVLVRELKKHLTRGGKYVDPYNNILLTNSSFQPAPPPDPQTSPSSSASAYLLPSFTYLPHIPLDSHSIETFIRAHLLAPTLHPSHQPTHLLRSPSLQSTFPTARPITEILVLICAHNARDTRCGILGPLLASEFQDSLPRVGIDVLEDGREPSPPSPHGSPANVQARVGLISHIGGHKWAGNVIVYIPPSVAGHALRGKGIWYGRVETGHVEGIVRETVVGGKVIKELFRGGVGQGGEVLRL